MRDFRGDLRALGRVLVPTGEGRGRFRLEQLATIKKEGRMHSLAEPQEAMKRICRAHDRRHLYLVPARTSGLPADLPDLEVEH